MPGEAVRCRARATGEEEISGLSTEMTAPAPELLESENMWLSMRAGIGRGLMAWPLTPQIRQPATDLLPTGRRELDRRTPQLA